MTSQFPNPSTMPTIEASGIVTLPSSTTTTITDALARHLNLRAAMLLGADLDGVDPREVPFHGLSWNFTGVALAGCYLLHAVQAPQWDGQEAIHGRHFMLVVMEPTENGMFYTRGIAAQLRFSQTEGAEHAFVAAELAAYALMVLMAMLREQQ